MSNVLKTNADAVSLDLTGHEIHPMTSTSILGPGFINLELLANKFGIGGEDPWSDPKYRVSLKLNSAEMVKVLLQALAEVSAADPALVRAGTRAEWNNGNEWMHYLLTAIDPARADLTIQGHCADCERPAIARADKDGATIDVWVHLGVSCGHGDEDSGVRFRLGAAPHALR